MPVAALKNIVKASGKSMKDIEKYWKEAKKQAKDQGFEEDSDRFWAYVMAITMKRAGLEPGSLGEAFDSVFDAKEEMRKIVEFDGNERKVMMIWEKAKEQAELLHKSRRITDEQVEGYAFDILKLGVGYKNKVVEAKEDDVKVGEVITKAEWEELSKYGYEKSKLSKKQIKTVEKEVAAEKEKRGDKFTIAGIVGNLVLGFVGGYAVAKAIDAFFSSLKSD